MSGGFLIKRFVVSVGEYGSATYEAATRGKALAMAWRSALFEGWTFKDFLRKTHAWRAHDLPERFGDPITVDGRPAFFIEMNRQYVRFVRPYETNVFNAHPYDVEPVEYRPDTYRPTPEPTQ